MGFQRWSSGKTFANSKAFRLFAVAVLFAICLGPTFISYQPYFFQWDDSDYFARSIGVSLAFWAGNSHELVAWMVSQHPPVMTLFGIPWGPLRSWPSAGNSFVTLAALISLVVAVSFYLLLRIGMRPLTLAVASVCVGISLGPFPGGTSIHEAATAFMADSLFAFIALAALLLVPYESRTQALTTRSSVFRGLLWGSILSLGTMTKLSFLYFVISIVPLLFLIRLRRSGRRSAVTSLIACVCCSSPVALYLLRWGTSPLYLAKSSSFGGMARFYFSPLTQFLGNAVREAPGLGILLSLISLALIYLAIKRPSLKTWPDFAALLVLLGFGIIVLASPNREIRFLFPLIVALPFLTGIAVSGTEASTSNRWAFAAAGIVFCGLLAAAGPTRSRPKWQSFSRCNAVLAKASQLRAGNIILATDSPTLNGQLMMVAGLYAAAPANIYSLAYSAMSGAPIEQDYRAMSSADLVVFQDRAALNPAFTNQRVSEYERFVRRVAIGSARVTDDTSVYLIRMR